MLIDHLIQTVTNTISLYNEKINSMSYFDEKYNSLPIDFSVGFIGEALNMKMAYFCQNNSTTYEKDINNVLKELKKK